MNGRHNKVLMPLAAAFWVVSLAVLLKPWFFSSHAPKLSPVAVTHSAAPTAGNSNPSVRQNSPHGMAVNGATNSAINNTSNNQTHSPSAYTIYHPPPVVLRHIHGIVNRGFSYPVRFIMAMASAAGGQTIALATEGQGLVMFRPAAQNPHRWVQFHPNKNGTGFPAWNTYSVCFDAQGRLWVGTLRKGVIVGKLGRRGWRWRRYNEICSQQAVTLVPNDRRIGNIAFNGPIGSHIVAIAENPLDKSIWMASEAGLSIYYPRGSLRKDTDANGTADGPAGSIGNVPMLFGRWRYITQANDLPSSPVDCLAFDRYGNLFAGTQCSGIALARPQDGYAHWQMTTGPEHATRHGRGNGLPSNLINAICVDQKTDHVYAATDWGLGISDDDGASWHYIRGQDYAAKVAQRWHPPKNWQPPDPQSLSQLLPGDHITSLAEDFNGRIWLGTWRNGYAIYQPGEGIVYHNILPKNAWRHGGDYVNAILPVHLDENDSVGIGGPAKMILVGRYGTVGKVNNGPAINIAWQGGDNPARHINERQPNVRFPAAAKPPTRDQLAQMADQLATALKRSSDKAKPQIIPITDDWRTEGSWLGRYGRYWACLFACATYGGADYVWRPGGVRLQHRETIGPHHAAGDTIQYYTSWQATAKRRVLELPEIDLNQRIMMHRATWAKDRRETEIDDHGERYPQTWQGPGMYEELNIPAAWATLSLYFFNPNGHSTSARERDYALSAIALPSSYHFVPPGRFNILSAAGTHPSVRGRVANFCGGVWKRFLVRGPMKLAIHVGKNYSFNTLIQSAMLDPLAQHPAPYYAGRRAWRKVEQKRAAVRAQLVAQCRKGVYIAPVASDRIDKLDLPEQILQLTSALAHRDPAAWAANQELPGILILRRCGSSRKAALVAAASEKCYYKLSLFRSWEALEKSRGTLSSRQIEKRMHLGNAASSSYAGLAFGLIRWRVGQLRHPHRAIDTAQRLESMQWLLDGGGATGKVGDH